VFSIILFSLEKKPSLPKPDGCRLRTPGFAVGAVIGHSLVTWTLCSLLGLLGTPRVDVMTDLIWMLAGSREDSLWPSICSQLLPWIVLPPRSDFRQRPDVRSAFLGSSRLDLSLDFTLFDTSRVASCTPHPPVCFFSRAIEAFLWAFSWALEKEFTFCAVPPRPTSLHLFLARNLSPCCTQRLPACFSLPASGFVPGLTVVKMLPGFRLLSSRRSSSL